jgi:hypothetical protein
MTPVMISLVGGDSAQLSPDVASYTNVDVEQAIEDFIGTGPGQFGNDFIVSERPLTTAEAGTATTNGRSFAYVPFAATPVALMTLVPDTTYTGSQTIQANQYCRDIPLTLAQLDGIYGSVSPPYSSWADSRLTSAPSCSADSLAVAKWGNLDPTMENASLESLLDSTTASQMSFKNGLTADVANGQANTVSTGPSENWPFPLTAISGGDQPTLGKLIQLNPNSDAPGTEASAIALGAIMPVADVWTGAPLGVPWNLPTAAVQNAAGAFVPPTATAAEAAESHATVTATSDPTTNNIVTFNPDGTDMTAYNNFLMMESYLVVPTNGLAPDKAMALAQFIRFALGGQGQQDIQQLGAAGATPAMVTAGLQVAQLLDQEAVSNAATTTTTTGGTTTTTATCTSGTTSTTTSTAPTTTSTSSTSTTTAPSTTTTSSTSTTTTTSTSTTTTTTTPTTTTSSTTTTTTPSTTTTTCPTADSTTTTSTRAGGATTTTSGAGGAATTGASNGSGTSTNPAATSSDPGTGSTAVTDPGTGSLAVTGINPAPLTAIGFAFFAAGEIALRLLRRRQVRM